MYDLGVLGRIVKHAGIRGGIPRMPPVLVLPEILEPIRRHFGVTDRVHDIFMAHVVLEGSSVMPIIGELIAGRMAQHVRMDGER
jgi:hypothetical protein